MNKFVTTIFGASGDSTKRKLTPALYSLYVAKRLPEEFEILRVGHAVYEDADYWTYIYSEMEKLMKPEEQNKEKMGAFTGHFYYLAIGPALENGYGQLQLRIEESSGDSRSDDLLSYLATPPSLYGAIPLHLKLVHLNEDRARIIAEKPFGYDLESTEKLNQTYASVLSEHQIHRADHFLGKETAQNLLVFRFANGILEPLWNRNHINYVEVTTVENLGTGQRDGFYDITGALRDMVQNHLIQLVVLTAMEPLAVLNADNSRNEVVKVYKSLTPSTETDLNERIIRGRYTAGENKRGYQGERNIAPDSCTGTYVAMKLGTSNWRWSRMPFYIRIGRQMSTKVTEIVVYFRETPYQMFHCVGGNCSRANKLIPRLQPNEGIVLKFGMKASGPGFEVKQVMVDFNYDQLGGIPGGDAYVRLIEDCIPGDQTLFTRSDVVEASWHFFDPILRYWNEHPEVSLYGYPAGTRGPLESGVMMYEHSADWTSPRRNLTNTDQYCEL